jgi:hypothetical protein
LDQGEIDEKPSPTPKISKIRDSAAAPEAPAKIALHDTPDEVVSDDTSNIFRSVVVIIIPILIKPQVDNFLIRCMYVSAHKNGRLRGPEQLLMVCLTHRCFAAT